VLPELISTGVAWFLAWLFGWAALHKFRAPAYYGRLIRAHLPQLPAVAPLVRVVAVLELAIALALVVPLWRTAGLQAGAALLVSYAALMALQLARGVTDMQCGCAGPASTVSISVALVVRNLVCAALALLALTPLAGVPVGAAGTMLSAFVAAFAVVIYLCSEQLISNAQQMAGDL
jgi:hypothetical protein